MIEFEISDESILAFAASSHEASAVIQAAEEFDEFILWCSEKGCN